MHGTEIAVSIGSILAALVPVVAMYFVFRQTDRRDRHTGDFERIQELEKKCEHLEGRTADLEDENLRLMRELFKRDHQ